jgi:DNA-3-methyladenine glycosylase II
MGAVMSASPMRLDRVSLLAGVRGLTRRDRDLATLVARYGPPPLWARRPGFTTLLRIILEQQVTLASARALYDRLAAAVHPFDATGILAVGTAGLQGLGVTRQKAKYVHALADQVTQGHLPLHRLGKYPDAEALTRLRAVAGIGPWTASIYLLMALRRPDVWPPGDLALEKAVSRLLGSASRLSVGELEQVTARWRPFRAVAARILWHAYLEERARPRSATGSALSRPADTDGALRRV